MIGRLTGSVAFIESDQTLMDVGGVGYVIYVPSSTLSRLSLGENLTFWVYTHFKESEMSLFGFLTLEEKKLFEILITVQGVGGKMALAILGAMDMQSVINAIMLQDFAPFKKVSGIGPKLATRIIHELKDKKELCAISSELNAKSQEHRIPSQNSITIISEASSALVSLGFVKNDVLKVVTGIVSNHSSITLEELIRESLTQLSQIR